MNPDLEQHREALETCSFCPKLCRFACPVGEAEGRETVTPWGLMTLADDMRRGFVEMTPSRGEIWTHCTGCGACTASCLHEVPVGSTIMSLRALARDADSLPDALDTWGMVPPDLSAKYMELPDVGDTLILAGHLGSDQLDTALQIIERLGVDKPYRPHGRASAGGRLLQAGLREEFLEHAGRLSSVLLEARRVLCLDPTDYHTLLNDWPNDIAGRTSVETLVQLVYSQRDRLEPVISGDAVLMENCQLSRFSEQSESTRAIVRALVGGALVEPVLRGENSGCCGAGAGFRALHPEHAARVGNEALFDTGNAPVIAFGQCVSHLRASVPEREVMGWIRLVSESLRVEGA